MLDVAGNRKWRELKRVLAPEATVVIVGGPKVSRVTGSLGNSVRTRVASIGSSQTVVAPFLGKMNRDDLVAMQELLEAGTVTPIVDRQYALSDVPEAFRYLGEGHARAKIVITV